MQLSFVSIIIVAVAFVGFILIARKIFSSLKITSVGDSKLTRSDWKLFAVLLAALNLPLLFIPVLGWLIWINIAGIPLSLLVGEPYFRTAEFGVIPVGRIGWGLVILFWIVFPFLITLLIKKVRIRKQPQIRTDEKPRI